MLDDLVTSFDRALRTLAGRPSSSPPDAGARTSSTPSSRPTNAGTRRD